MRLQIKVLLFVMVILLITGIISGGIMLYLQRTASISQFQQMAVALAHAVQSSLEQGMMLGDRSHIQDAIVRIGQEEMVTEIAVFSVDGIIAASSNPSEIGQAADGENVLAAIQPGRVSTQTIQQNGSLDITTPIFNKSECQSCHNEKLTVLGGIRVTLDNTSINNQIRQQTISFAVFGALTLLIIGIGLAFALKKIILTPLSDLADSAERLSRGDYAARAPKSAADEIGMLAGTFDEMAQSVEQRTSELQSSQKELARWNLDLEDKIRQRTHELEKANEIREQLLQKLISAQEEERRRIARELHDNANQSLAAVVINMTNIADDLPDEYTDVKDKLNLLKEQTIQTLDGIRNLALELRPSVLDDLGLTSAIDWYARDYLSKRGLDVEIEINSQRKLPSYTETTLFRIIQEALTNIVKHAEANKVKIQLNVTDSQAIVQVTDNGKGFDVDKVLRPDGLRQNLGIQGMAERASLLNGSFTIDASPGKGSSLRVTVPLADTGETYG